MLCPVRAHFVPLMVSDSMPLLYSSAPSSAELFQPRRLELAPLLASSLGFDLCVRLPDLRVKELVRLATLSFLITVDADVRTRCSLWDRVVMPGNGRISRLQTSASSASSRARSLREGASTGIRAFVVSRDWERLMVDAVEALLVVSRTMLVFFSTTWHSGDLAPTVVALYRHAPSNGSRLSKDSAHAFHVQVEKAEQTGIPRLEAVPRWPRQPGPPFHLLGRAGRHYDLVQLIVVLKHQLPRERGRVALQSSSVVHILDPDPVQVDAGLNDVYWIRLPRRGKPEDIAIEEADQILPVNSARRLPADVQRAAKTNVPKGADSVLGCSIEPLVGEYQSVLEQSNSLELGLHQGIVGGPVDLGRRLSQSREDAVDFHVRVCTV